MVVIIIIVVIIAMIMIKIIMIIKVFPFSAVHNRKRGRVDSGHRIVGHLNGWEPEGGKSLCMIQLSLP